MKYILDGKEVIEEPDLIAWAKWFEKADRNVARTELPNDVIVSTVFLGIDHNFIEGGVPILFETLTFGGELDGETERYVNWEQAELGHERMVDRIRWQS